MIDLYNFLLAYTYILYNLYMKICVLSSSCMFTGAHPPPTKTTYPPKPPVSGNSLEAATAHHNGTRKRCSPLSKRRSLRITRREFNMEELASMIGWQWWMIFTENDSMYCVIYIYIYIFSFLRENRCILSFLITLVHFISENDWGDWQWLRHEADDVWEILFLEKLALQNLSDSGGLVWCMKKIRQYWWFPLFTLAQIDANPNRSSKLSALNH